MENDKFLNLGKNFYDWYRSNKVNFTIKASNPSLDSEIKRVAELIEYVVEKKRLKG